MSVLVGLDREFDSYNTPRICGLLDINADILWLGSITADALAVLPVRVKRGELAYISTYEFPLPLTGQLDHQFEAGDAPAICRHVIQESIFKNFDKPICAAAAKVLGGQLDIATLNVAGAEDAHKTSPRAENR
jgi:IMP cyclohydrolase